MPHTSDIWNGNPVSYDAVVVCLCIATVHRLLDRAPVKASIHQEDPRQVKSTQSTRPILPAAVPHAACANTSTHSAAVGVIRGGVGSGREPAVLLPANQQVIGCEHSPGEYLPSGLIAEVVAGVFWGGVGGGDVSTFLLGCWDVATVCGVQSGCRRPESLAVFGIHHLSLAAAHGASITLGQWVS